MKSETIRHEGTPRTVYLSTHGLLHAMLHHTFTYFHTTFFFALGSYLKIECHNSRECDFASQDHFDGQILDKIVSKNLCH